MMTRSSCDAAMSGSCTLTFEQQQPNKDMHIVRVESFEPKCCKNVEQLWENWQYARRTLMSAMKPSGLGSSEGGKRREKERGGKSGCCVSQLAMFLLPHEVQAATFYLCPSSASVCVVFV